MEQNEICPNFSCDVETLQHREKSQFIVPIAFNYFNVRWQLFSASPKVDPGW